MRPVGNESLQKDCSAIFLTRKGQQADRKPKYGIDVRLLSHRLKRASNLFARSF